MYIYIYVSIRERRERDGEKGETQTEFDWKIETITSIVLSNIIILLKKRARCRNNQHLLPQKKMVYLYPEH